MSLEQIIDVFPVFAQILSIAIPASVMTTLVSIFSLSFVIGLVLFIISIL